MSDFLVYGANGYTGALIARTAVGRGLRPVLAGRNAVAVARLAGELHLEHRVFGLDVPAEVDAGFHGVRTVIHCAGPFAHTARAMADACLRTRTHYLDLTGEVAVFESLAARDAEAKAVGVMLLPGAGFDVVPTDCLAAHLKRRLPSATHLALAIQALTRLSRGTATTMVENLAQGGLVRRRGQLVPVPAGWKTRAIDFGDGSVTCMTIPWGDVSTAYHSTGIPNIEVYSAAPLRLRIGARLLRPFGWLVGSTPLQSWLKRRIQAGPTGPSAEERAHGRSNIWGEAADATGRRVVARLHGPEGYDFTVLTALAAVGRVLAGDAPPGFQTPSRAFGPDFVLTIEGVVREDDNSL